MRKTNPVAHCNYCDVVEDSCTRILSWCIDSPTQKHDFNKCEPQITHVKPCLNLNNGSSSCSCGCDAYGNWCVVQEQMHELSTSLHKYTGMMNSNIMEEKLKEQFKLEINMLIDKLSMSNLSITDLNNVTTSGTMGTCSPRPTDTTIYNPRIFTAEKVDYLIDSDSQLQQFNKLLDTISIKDNQSIKEPTVPINLEMVIAWMKDEASDEERQKLYEMLYNFGCRVFK